MRNYIYLCLFFIFTSLVVSGCATFRESGNLEPPYRWSSFFNNKCGPILQFNLTSEDEAILSYPCSNGIVVRQFARRQQRQGKVELWITSELPREQLFLLSRSKCRASLIYLGPTHAAIKFPCALVHLTVTCEIVSTESMDATTAFQLNPTKVLITYGDGVQEFRVEEDRLMPLGPFKPFKTPQPSLPVTIRARNSLPYMAINK